MIIAPYFIHLCLMIVQSMAQYICDTAIYLLSILAHYFQIVIDWEMGAPGHEKYAIDGLN